jgi:F-type H+-transporting ATPase subunit epsilon
LPTQAGQITVLPNHIPLLSALQAGELIIKNDKEEIALAVSSGFIEVKPNSEVVVLTETAEHADEIDEAKAQAAKDRAEKLLQDSKGKEAVDYTALAGKIAKELARLKVAKRKSYGQHQPKIESES